MNFDDKRIVKLLNDMYKMSESGSDMMTVANSIIGSESYRKSFVEYAFSSKQKSNKQPANPIGKK